MEHVRNRMVWMAYVVVFAIGVTSSVAATPKVKQAPVGPAPVQHEAALAQLPAPVVETESLPATVPDASDAQLLDVSPAVSQAESACSPPPQCFRDKDCDGVCGKGNGVCVRINSCYRACACAS